MKLKRKIVQPLVAYRYVKDSPRPEEIDPHFKEVAFGEAHIDGMFVQYGDYVILDEDNKFKVFKTEYIREHFEEEL